MAEEDVRIQGGEREREILPHLTLLLLLYRFKPITSQIPAPILTTKWHVLNELVMP